MTKKAKKVYKTNNRKKINETNKSSNILKLTEEQERMIEYAKMGYNVLVDACVGSGKTTSIQKLCEQIREKKILYLTYNRLLKFDAQNKIKSQNVTVTNYNSYVNNLLIKNNIYVGVDEQLEIYLEKRFEDDNSYDLLIIDEYQDIEKEHADLIKLIKERNNNIQIIFVGDLKQKIYDNSRIEIKKFVNSLLGKHKTVKYTKCFRLSKSYAKRIGKIWGKEIVGVNSDLTVNEWNIKKTVEFLKKCAPAEILCLGTNYKKSDRVCIQNALEEEAPDKFNKNTLYSSISEEDNCPKKLSNVAILTTFDRCKGIERDVCVICDFTDEYWENRSQKPMQRYEILRNIFCVAMSRGKRHIIFVNNTLSDQKLKSKYKMITKFTGENFHVTKMFDYKYKEDIKECCKAIKIRKIESKEKVVLKDNSIIKVERMDGMIDLSPGVGIFQDLFFNKYSIDKQIEYYEEIKYNGKSNSASNKKMDDQEKILKLISLETGQNRYKSVKKIISPESADKVSKRLEYEFRKDENVQVRKEICFGDKNIIIGMADVLKDDIVWELKFVSSLKQRDYLQCAMYILLLEVKKGILWNTMKNEMYEIKIPNRKIFLDKIIYAITRGAIKEYRDEE